MCSVMNSRGSRHSSLSQFEQMVMSRGLCEAFQGLELGENEPSDHKPQCVFLCHTLADSRDPNVAFDAQIVMLMAHRALVHNQFDFSLSYASEHERVQFRDNTSAYGAMPHRASMKIGKRWFSSGPVAELFASEYNLFSSRNLFAGESSIGVHLQFSFAFVSNRELMTCSYHRCDVFDALCGCCREMRWRFTSLCQYSNQPRCDACELTDKHTTCYTHHKFQTALWTQDGRMQQQRYEASPRVAPEASQNAV